MRCHLTDDVEAYAAQASPLLEAEPVANNVALTVIEGARAGRYDGAVFAWVEDSGGGVVVGAASHTPPFRLLLPAMPMAAVDAVCDRLLETGHRLPGVTGPVEQTARFADRWSGATGAQVRLKTAERLYRLDQLTPPVGVPGALRQAGTADLSLVADWITGFSRDAGLDQPVDPHLDAARRVGDAQVHLWHVGARAVSMAAHSYPVGGVVRISLVFTPPRLRRHGYAGASVAELSRSLLDAGNRDCMLYTDLANPTSNSVYQRIGYRPVLDAQELIFEEMSATYARHSGRPRHGAQAKPSTQHARHEAAAAAKPPNERSAAAARGSRRTAGRLRRGGPPHRAGRRAGGGPALARLGAPAA